MKAISLTIPESFSRMQDESDVGEACFDEVNGRENEIDVLRALLRKHKIVIPDIPSGQKQLGQSELLEKAYKVIDDLKSQIVKLEESIREKNKWLVEFNENLIVQTNNVENQRQQIDGLQADSKYQLGKLQDNHLYNLGHLREYAKSLPKQVKA